MSKLEAKNTIYNDPRYDVVVDSRMLEQHLKEKDQQIAELKQQLAEKEKEIEELKKEIRDELVDNNMAILELQQSQNQTAIDELEKAKEIFGRVKWYHGYCSFGEVKYFDNKLVSWTDVEKEIDNQIKSLKGE